jgi:hypothetical protein
MVIEVAKVILTQFSSKEKFWAVKFECMNVLREIFSNRITLVNSKS